MKEKKMRGVVSMLKMVVVANFIKKHRFFSGSYQETESARVNYAKVIHYFPPEKKFQNTIGI